MSSRLEAQAESDASVLHQFRRQIFQSVPSIPSNVNLEGKTVLVTGSNNGLGLQCARHFLRLRPHLLIMAVRSLEKGEAEAAKLRDEFEAANIHVWELDMASYKSVQAFAARCEAELDRIDIAVLNAATGKMNFERAAEGGRETTIHVNYLSTVLLAILLLPRMKPTATSTRPGRLTIIGSDNALRLKLNDIGSQDILEYFNQPENFEGLQQYGLSKLLGIMFVAKLSEIVNPDDIIINVCNPGATKGTSLMREMDGWLMKTLFTILFGITGRTPVEAAKIYLHGSLVLGEESHGSFTDWQVRAWPLTMYTDHGRRMNDKLWDETMKELAFARVDGILKGVSAK